MKPKAIWSTELKNGILGGLTPVSDPFDNTKFYISDGWGSAYPSMKLRQLSFENGKELNAVSIKNSVRCLYFNPDKKNIFAVSDSKIFQIDRAGFSVIRKFEKGIQKYSDFISSNDKDTLLLMSSGADFLFVYNYNDEKGTKKKLKSCRGIFKESDTEFLIFCARTGSVQQFDLRTGKLKEILQAAIFCEAYKSKSDKLYLHPGKIVEATSATRERIEPVNQIDIYLKSDLTKKIAIKFDFDFDKFIVSESEEKLYLIKDNQIGIYSFLEQKTIDKITLNEKERVAQIFDKQQLFVSYEYDKANIITCWRL